ncbi:septation protein SepH [Vallicoccus soli]|uniref:DUF3071 domain-containing protein n=1 Tax=Vallicoccus soli TaxID=2339232 RepID=A0A3A3ZKC3_9ACTN|nr:septation protein SepH [Vallicoccus soli]RJK96270.1 DUF3071 domain-containing protein [Vallicoccus soli]
MDDLQLVGLTEDGEHLVVAASHGEQFRLPLDDRLLAAIRGDLVRLGQLQIELESQLRPAEIQARIRAGASAEEVAMAAGIPVAKVRRYEGPVLAEREHVAGLARRAPARRRGDGFVPALGALVEERAAARGVPADALRWDAAQREDRTWTVSVVLPAGAAPVRASWVFDPRRGLLSPLDDEAAALSGEEAPPRPAPEPRSATVRRLSSVPRRSREAADALPMPFEGRTDDDPAGAVPPAPDAPPTVAPGSPDAADAAGAPDDADDGLEADLELHRATPPGPPARPAPAARDAAQDAAPAGTPGEDVEDVPLGAVGAPLPRERAERGDDADDGRGGRSRRRQRGRGRPAPGPARHAAGPAGTAAAPADPLPVAGQAPQDEDRRGPRTPAADGAQAGAASAPGPDRLASPLSGGDERSAGSAAGGRADAPAGSAVPAAVPAAPPAPAPAPPAPAAGAAPDEDPEPPAPAAADDAAEEAPQGPAARRAPARHGAKGRRAAVPAWDDIVFGTRRKD